MKLDTINKEGIDRLMEIFYEKIRRDKDLGAIFNAKVGTDDEAWQNHKAKISNFWQGMLLGQGDYNGQPMKAHIELPPFPREFFDTWLKLFEESLNQVFNEEMSAVILQRAQMIARNFQNVLYAGR
ncbi:hypothetical protein DMB95_03455 [Campylobacter sp. MIT 12-8780]|uniref:group III truncated hemoglobin n=1 Tax=unclassified Campylobacter TaxID=2593542 RepID=UPI0010F9B694|nr:MULTISPECIES: group III truncated hemoglobin [unclassified Campylobacter]NDJ26878.1 group III truncated hemoglobin [Campylobacter sp. MIT 19-121]TKX28623.1 hypothetical protein CQA38_07015 [Campylobacter sp. MIT 12-5580]TQR41978.1 hypothetical protein DMB95_03455 [Campylobacter sp. MIT 12-8780]